MHLPVFQKRAPASGRKLTRRKARRLSPLILAMLTTGTLALRAEDRAPWAGTWSAGPLVERWVIGDWGNACGPRPAGRAAGAVTVTVVESGGELRFSGGGYPTTASCYDMGPGVRVTSHVASGRSWQNECATAPNDSRRARLRTTIGATNSAISFDETGEYQFVLKRQNCTASVRRSRTYSLVPRAGDVAPSPMVPAAPISPPRAEEPPAAPAGRCASIGEATRLEVRPARKLLRPGEAFTFRALVLDAAGCRVATTPTWTALPTPANGPRISVASPGIVTVAGDSGEGEAIVSVAVAGKTISVAVNVVTSDRYGDLLKTGVESTGEEEVATATLAAPRLGTTAAVAEDSARRRKRLFLWIVGGSGAGFVLLAWLLKRKPSATVSVEEDVPVEGAPPELRQVPRAKTPSTISAITPADPHARAMLCPVCGTRYDAQAKFCGREGATLVRVN